MRSKGHNRQGLLGRKLPPLLKMEPRKSAGKNEVMGAAVTLIEMTHYGPSVFSHREVTRVVV